MPIEISLISRNLYVELPNGLAGWLGMVILFLFLVILARHWANLNKKWTRAQWGLFLVLVLFTPLTSLFLGLRLPAASVLPLPGRPVEPAGPLLVFFAALPWTLAAGWLGPFPAAVLGALSGLLLALAETHSPFTPLEIAFQALLLGVCFQQYYRTPTYRLLRQPLAAGFLIALVYPLLYLIDVLFFAGGALVNRVDFAVARLLFTALANAGELLIAALFAQAVQAALPALWGSRATLLPSPSERKLATRFLYLTALIALVLVITLIAGDWIMAGNAARQMLRERMATTAKTASDTVPFFLDSGQSLIKKYSQDQRLLVARDKDLTDLLSQDVHLVPFFRQLYYLDSEGKALAGYPLDTYSSPPTEEILGVQLAAGGVPIQDYTIAPVEGESVAQVTFLASVPGPDGKLQGILIGRSDLASNPFTQPVLSSLKEIAGEDGAGLLLDDKGRILYSTTGVRVMETYTGQTSSTPIFYDDRAADGTRLLVYYQPVEGQPWAVALSVPASRAQQLSIDIAAPLLGMVLAVSLLTVFFIVIGIRKVTANLQSLSAEANRIAQGQLDHPLMIEGEDEVGQLRRAFEQMRVSLKARLEELNRLLVVSQGVASSLDFSVAVQPVLEASLSGGACAARVVLAPASSPELDGHGQLSERIGLGSSRDLYSYLDDQVLDMTRQQDRLALNNVTRVRSLAIAPGMPRPEAILALALHHENRYHGTLWLAYDQPHQFSEDELRFFTTLAGQAALAAANSSLFQSAEIGRQRLAAILTSTPDPVLVTDQHGRLLLANPAAWQVLGIEMSGGQPIDKLVPQNDLVKLLRASGDEKQSVEVTMADGKVYLATASSVIADGQRVGRVCLLLDITKFKELDALKSEFVATVSHDLRSPLTLMHGYTTMLEMVGELNDQQVGYARKIVTAVESMSRLVNNLLDLGRTEAGIDLQLEMVLVHDIVEKVTGSLQLTAAQKKVQLNVEVPTQTVPLIEADPALLQQALYNLVENGIKYTEAGGKVNVTVKTRQEGLVFEVSDTGIGIAPVDQPRLFEKFFRGAQREGKKQSGTGLGLAIVKSIAERHGGRVWMESQLGKGSTFYLLVPLRQTGREHKNGKQKS